MMYKPCKVPYSSESIYGIKLGASGNDKLNEVLLQLQHQRSPKG